MEKVARISAVLLLISVVLFAVSMVVNYLMISYAICIILSWSYVALSICYMKKDNSNKSIYGIIGFSFAIMYSIIIQIVYYTQLTTVKNNLLTNDIANILSYQNLGSLMFNFDLYGYGLMAMSTLFIGLQITIKTKTEQWLKIFLIGHGLFAPICFIMPILNLFNSNMGTGGDNIGTIVLFSWCVIFSPICILSFKYFTKKSG